MNLQTQKKIDELKIKRENIKKRIVNEFNELSSGQINYLQDELIKIEKELRRYK